MLTGCPAHQERPVLELLHVVANEDLGPELAERVDRRYRELILMMLQRDPDRRPTMDTVFEKLSSSA